jgi:peptide/nickel transport system substrate-binding protein
MKHKLILTCIALFAALLLISCSSKKTVPGKDTSSNINDLPAVDTSGSVIGDWVIHRELADPQRLNPITVQDAIGQEYSLYIFEKLLFAADRTTMDPLPWLAESMPEVSPDHLIYTFKLKKNITFSNGKPLTGEDVIFTFKAMKNPLVDDASLRNYHESLKKIELVNGDKYTIRFTLSKPYFKAMLVLGDMQIMSKNVVDPSGLTDSYTLEDCTDVNSAKNNPAIKKFADFFNSEEMSRDPKLLIGSGPYVFEKWETGQYVSMVRNDNYWNQNGSFGMAYPKKIILKVIQDESAAVVSAKNREIDVMYLNKPVDYVKTVSNPEQFSMKKADPTEPRFDYIGYNMVNPLFSDVKVRWALAYLVDRKSIIEKIHFGMAVSIQSPVYFQDKKHFNPDLPEIPFDIEKAKQLLSEAGWKDSDGDGVLDKIIDGKKVNFKFTYLLNTNESRKQAILVIIDALKKAGIDADVQTLEWSVYLDKTKKHEFDATMGAWILSDYPPDEFQIFHSSQSKGEGSNFTSYKNDEADKLMEQYRQEFDETKRIEIIKKLQKIFYDDQAYSFTWTPKAKYIYGDRFKNVRWYPTPLTSYQLTEWWVPVNARKYQAVN